VPQRRSGRARNTNAQRSPSAQSSRGLRQPTQQVLAELESMISALIKDNRELHRQIDKLSKQSVGAASGAVERALRSIERRISGSLDGETTTGRRRSAKGTSTTKARGKGDGSATARAPTPDLGQS
jgi:N-methylhydantoinase B/oxoprolinase/acetone carboxylase alpha subunit